ncbi:MAG TPA: D-glycerate dehydrogenase [Bryobacteraceae bacterium]|nr:D-glycerate dehydrogenase [Bryobacteraceae bacterium]HOQ43941.1 D-glycerate dehydrogenase [Bryobacteraceae bacterium]HPU72919.1 D-glycerate dehydrogenase [Bryobacteraceae bacterium]
MKPAVLVTKRVFPEAIELLRRHAEVEYIDSDDGLPPEELLRRSCGKQGIVSQLTDKLTAERLAQFQGVRFIAHVGVGYDNIDVAAATRCGIMVTNTPDVLTDTTADLAFALLLAAARRIVEADHFLRSGQWRRWSIDLLAGHDVHHKTLGIFGMGRIGQAVARRARGFSMRVLYNDTRRAPEAIERELELEFVEKDRLLAESDFVSLHVPLTESTRHLIGAAELAKMKPSAIIVNTSRGPVIDEPALAEALSKGVIAGAGLDVFEEEPKVHPVLLELKNVALAPHIGSASIDTRRKMCMLAAENAVAALEGRRPPNLVNPEVLS